MACAEKLYSRIVITEIAVEQRGFDILAPAGSFAVQQREANRRRGVRAGTDIPDTHLWDYRRTIPITEHIENARISGPDHVKAGAVGERTTLPQSRHGTHYDLGVNRADDVIAQAHSPDRAWREIFHHYIDF
jgi:hypothetical protein